MGSFFHLLDINEEIIMARKAVTHKRHGGGEYHQFFEAIKENYRTMLNQFIFKLQTLIIQKVSLIYMKLLDLDVDLKFLYPYVCFCTRSYALSICLECKNNTAPPHPPPTPSHILCDPSPMVLTVSLKGIDLLVVLSIS